MQEKNNSRRRLYVLLLLIVLVAGAFALTVYASTRIAREVKRNYFSTGEIDINLNDGYPVIAGGSGDPKDAVHGYLFEPGVTVEKPFFVRNEGTGDFYYKIYFREVEGDLADDLEITIRDEEDKILFSGILADMTRLAVKPADDVLAPDEQRDLTITFHVPEGKGNEAQDKHVSFILCADAVQTKNNPNKEF